MALITDLPNLAPTDYGRANDLRREITLAKTYLEIYPGASKLQDFLDTAVGEDPTLPNGALLGAGSLVTPNQLTEGETYVVTLPNFYTVLDGTLTINDPQAVRTLEPVPPTGEGGEVSWNAGTNTLTAVSEGVAVFDIVVKLFGGTNDEIAYRASYHLNVLAAGI